MKNRNLENVDDKATAINEAEIRFCIAARITPADLSSRSRRWDISKIRQIMWFCMVQQGIKPNHLAKRYRYTHSTVLHAVKQVRNYIETNDLYGRIANKIIKKMESSPSGRD